jgi:hypothetical protein
VLAHKSARFFLVEYPHYTTIYFCINLKMDQTEKQLALETISAMPDDCSLKRDCRAHNVYGRSTEGSLST